MNDRKSKTPQHKWRVNTAQRVKRDELFIQGAGTPPRRNGDVSYPFRPESNFSHLCEISEAGAVLVYDGAENEWSLFWPLRSKLQLLWDGPVPSKDEVESVTGLKVKPLSEFDSSMERMLNGKRKVFLSPDTVPGIDQKLLTLLGTERRGISLVSIANTNEICASQRKVKRKSEIALMRDSGLVTCLAHKAAMSSVAKGSAHTEYDVMVAVDNEIRRNRGINSFDTIVAAGAGALHLHYTLNSKTLERGELVLVDAGAELHGFATDVSRTFPVSGRFSKHQARLVTAVCKAQEAVISAAVVGATLPDLNALAKESLLGDLIDLGLVRAKDSKSVRERKMTTFLPHGVSHWLGRDVHDVGLYRDADGDPCPLEEGNVLTVEPGLYIPKGYGDYSCIGIRVEDDVLVTSRGPETLTSCPRTVEEIETFMAS